MCLNIICDIRFIMRIINTSEVHYRYNFKEKARKNLYLWRNDWNRDASKDLTLLHLQQLTEKAGTN